MISIELVSHKCEELARQSDITRALVVGYVREDSVKWYLSEASSPIHLSATQVKAAYCPGCGLTLPTTLEECGHDYQVG